MTEFVLFFDVLILIIAYNTISVYGGPMSVDGLNTMEVNGVHQLFGYLYSSKYLLFFSKRKKSIQVSNNFGE